MQIFDITKMFKDYITLQKWRPGYVFNNSIINVDDNHFLCAARVHSPETNLAHHEIPRSERAHV